MSSQVGWVEKEFAELTLAELYAVLKLRQDVFVVEQQCCYNDIDSTDENAFHLLAMDAGNQLVGYSRIFAPGALYAEASIGRIIVATSARGTGLGGKLVQRGVEHCLSRYADAGIRIAAQAHLQKFYAGHGFCTVSEPHDVDGIPHVEMLRTVEPS